MYFYFLAQAFIGQMDQTTHQLTRSYFLNPDVVFLARDLLGKIIRTDFNGAICTGMITETEAYRAPEDKASHAYKNKRTKRTEVLFGPGGYAYVYLNYGIHHLFNLVTGPEGMAHAVLIRGIVPINNIEIQMKRRKKPVNKGPMVQLFNGPGKLSQALGITTLHTGLDLCDTHCPIQILDAGIIYHDAQIWAGPRIGIDYAEEWASVPWRFMVKT